MDEIERRLELANQRLKAGSVGVKLYIRGRSEKWLYLRATFPPKPESKRKQPYQQWLALKMRAQTGTIKEAELTARAVGLDLARNTFDWRKFSDWDDAKTEPKTIDHWIEQMERLWWATRDKDNPSHHNTWRVGYSSCLKWLPPKEELTEALLIDWVYEHSEPGSRRRVQYVTCAQRLLKVAGLPDSVMLKDLCGGQSIKPVNPRSLPTDAEIVQKRGEIKDEAWRWVFSVLATYGLRPHEIAFLDWSQYPTIRTHARTKTGERAIEPLYPEWAEWCKDVPDLEWDENNDKNGTKVTKWFKRHIGWSAYNLRHSYVRRCVEFGLPVDLAARLLGHDTSLHVAVYQQWIGEATHLNAIRNVIKKSEKTAPSQ
ncbi:hypothetical protein AVDCRST_MAG94-4292 [uncultured Leptolyngbya sp.]|uniref:Tyr recombinase domain-containing protein n=1 Tax=uncultured Leptolyngbya sp. TaxID=332963 RepID=A0A6J4N4D1_9CYAN|nr:hypothetical protein AVDCRST_MAG94-4292 [uncultured Leptolyngbya sp.]